MHEAAPDQHARLLIEYDGAHFRGWSRQPDGRTVEGVLLEALGSLSLEVTQLRVAGRTDSGVHASAQVSSLGYRGPVPLDRLGSALNQFLPADVSVLGADPCTPEFDARADATSRAYEYRVLPRRARSPLRTQRVLHHPRPLDGAALQAAAAAVVGQHDFAAFTPTQTDHVFFDRTILESFWELRGDELVYRIRANAFLRHMVRVLVGSMLAVGRGDWPLERFTALLQGAPREHAHHTVAPHGLCLVDVRYGEPGTG